MHAYTYDTQLDKLVALSNYNIPSKVQGIAFDSQGAVYLSTSLGRSNSSYLKVYSSLIALNQSPSTPSVKVEMPPCSEEIAIVDITFMFCLSLQAQSILKVQMAREPV